MAFLCGVCVEVTLGVLSDFVQVSVLVFGRHGWIRLFVYVNELEVVEEEVLCLCEKLICFSSL